MQFLKYNGVASWMAQLQSQASVWMVQPQFAARPW